MPAISGRTSPHHTGGACAKAQPPPATPQVLSRGREAVTPTVGHSDTAVAGRFGVSPAQRTFIARRCLSGAAPVRTTLTIDEYATKVNGLFWRVFTDHPITRSRAITRSLPLSS